MKKPFIAIMVLAVAALSLDFDGTATATWQAQLAPVDKIGPGLRSVLEMEVPGDKVRVIVTLADQADLSTVTGTDRAARLQSVIRLLQTQASASQLRLAPSLQMLQAQDMVSDITPFWIFNGFAVAATPDGITQLAARPEVRSITPDQINVVPAAPLAYSTPEPNLEVVHASALWDMGYFGQGIVVASLDSGVFLYHPDLLARWRGGSNSWYDPYNQHPVTPVDLSGHGTWTTGVIVAGDAGGTSIGMAPQAQWIAVKIFNDAGTATATAVHSGFQWLLDPDDDLTSADAPNVINNSWAFGSPGCNLEFQLDLQALRAANILPVFAAGNYGPGGSTSASPANNPPSFAVGATNSGDQIYVGSSRGPSSCGEEPTIYPELVAPGVNINTTNLYGMYEPVSGTSIATSHVTGALALLLSAFPNLTADQQADALASGAVDLGTVGPDNDFGYGRLDVLAAYQWLQTGGATPTPTPTATPTPVLPVVSEVSATPNPTGGEDSVTLTAVATNGEMGVTAAEWFTGADPGAGNGTAMTLAGGNPWSLSATIDVSTWASGDYTIYVRAKDAADNWGATSPVLLTVSPPLAVTLASFTAVPQGDHVLVSWETVDEVDTMGFNLYRSLSPSGERTRLTFVPAQNPGGAAGASYAYPDADVAAGQVYYYWLKDIDMAGVATLHGPVIAKYSVPTAVSLIGIQALPADSARPVGVMLLATATSLVSALAVWRRRA